MGLLSNVSQNGILDMCEYARAGRCARLDGPAAIHAFRTPTMLVRRARLGVTASTSTSESLSSESSAVRRFSSSLTRFVEPRTHLCSAGRFGSEGEVTRPIGTLWLPDSTLVVFERIGRVGDRDADIVGGVDAILVVVNGGKREEKPR